MNSEGQVADMTTADVQPLSVVAQLAKLQRREVLLRSELHRLNRAHRRTLAALRRQSEAGQALRDGIITCLGAAMSGNMTDFSLRVLTLCTGLRARKRRVPQAANGVPS